LEEKSINIEDVLSLPLDPKEQKKAVEEKVPCVAEGRLKVYDPNTNNVKKFLELFRAGSTVQWSVSMTGCVHCGMCSEVCHYALARPHDPTMVPALKGDQIRRIFKKLLTG